MKVLKFPLLAGYRRWDFDTYKYIGASDSAIDAWEREDFATLIQMFKAHHAPYQGSGISTHFLLPMQKRLSYGNFQQRAAYRDKTSHALFATGRYEWFYTRFHATLKKVLRLLIILPQRNWLLPSPAPSTNSKHYDKTPVAGC